MSRGMSDMYGNLEDDTVPLRLCGVSHSSCKITKQTLSSRILGQVQHVLSCIYGWVGGSKICLLETSC